MNNKKETSEQQDVFREGRLLKETQSFSTQRIKQSQYAIAGLVVLPFAVFGLVIASLYVGNTNNENINAASSSLQYGIVTGGDTDRGVNGAASLGIHMARFYEIGRGDSPSVLDSSILNAAKKGVEPIILIDDDDMAKTTSAGNAGAVAARFGPGGTFWQAGQPGSGYGQYAPRWLEWGNEESYSYKGTQNNGGVYGQSANAAADAVNTANPRMKLIVQGEDGGSGSRNWLDGLCGGSCTGINSKIGGWTVHPYGPDTGKMDRMVTFLSQKGVTNPQIFITEDGLATDNGRNLNNNYGWPTNMTYDQASSAIQQKVSLIKSKSFASNIRVYMQYQAHDQKTSGSTSEREHYFGIFKSDGSDKGSYTSTVRSLAAANPRDGNSVSPTPAPSPSPSPTPSPSPSSSYDFIIDGTTMKWNAVAGASQYKVYLADTKTYIHLSSATLSYKVPSPASGNTRQVGWTWFDGSDHWVTEKTITFTSQSTPPPAPDPTPTPTPTNDPDVPEVVVIRPSDPPPLISIPDANPDESVKIPNEVTKNEEGQITADFNGDGLNDIAFDLNNDGYIDPYKEIVIDGTNEPNLTNQTKDPILIKDNYSSNSGTVPTPDPDTITIKAGPLPEAKISKPVAYTFLAFQGIAISGLALYLAITKLAIFAGLKGKLGL